MFHMGSHRKKVDASETFLEIEKYKRTTLATALTAFLDAPTGNNVIGLWSQSVSLLRSVNKTLNTNSSLELRNAWNLASGEDIAGLRVVLIEIRDELLELVKDLEVLEVTISGSFNRARIKIDYPTLTTQQSVPIVDRINALRALVVIDA